MTKANYKQAKHMRQSAARPKRGKAGIVALALAGVLAVGGVSAVCVAGLGKSPGQAPAVAAQAAKPAAATKAVSKPATTTTKAADKPATQQAAAKPAQQAQPQQQAKPAAQPQRQAQPQAAVRAEQSSETGMEVRVSREGAIAAACDHVGAGGQAKGEAMNVSARGPITGGGTVYYVVELDLGDVHYSVSVDATQGNVIGADQVHAGTRTLLDQNGDPQEGTETPVDA